MKTYTDIPYVENATEMQLLDIYLPEKEGFDTIIFLHGGGITSGNRKNIGYLDVESFLAKGFGLVGVEYHLYPDAKFPEFIQDSAAAVAYVLNNIGKYGGNGNVIIAGASAGAYITMMLCMDHRYLEAVGVKQEQIKAYISDSAQQFCHFNVLKEMGLDERLERIDEHAPICFVREGLKIRPVLLIYYSDDIKCRPEETRLMYASIKNLMPEAVVSIEELPGTHCCKPREADGSLILTKKVCEFLERVGS